MKNCALARGGLSTCAVIALLSSATAEPIALNSSEYISGTKIKYVASANGEVISFDNGRTINLVQGVLENVELRAPASGDLTVENPFTIENPAFTSPLGRTMQSSRLPGEFQVPPKVLSINTGTVI